MLFSPKTRCPLNEFYEIPNLLSFLSLSYKSRRAQLKSKNLMSASSQPWCCSLVSQLAFSLVSFVIRLNFLVPKCYIEILKSSAIIPLHSYARSVLTDPLHLTTNNLSHQSYIVCQKKKKLHYKLIRAFDCKNVMSITLGSSHFQFVFTTISYV